MSLVESIDVADIDLSDSRFWNRPREGRFRVFDVLRRERPVSSQAPAGAWEPRGFKPSLGYWAIIRYAEVRAFCLGAYLARFELRALFWEVFRLLPDIDVSGKPIYLSSPFLAAIQSPPCSFSPSESELAE